MANNIAIRMASQQGLLPLSPQVGVDLLLKLMMQTAATVVTACPMDPNLLPATPYFNYLRGGRVEAGFNTNPSGEPLWLVELRGMGPLPRKEAIFSKVLGVLAGVGVEGLEGTTVWGEAGLDSLGMVEVRNGVVRAFENAVPLGATALFDYPTLNALVQHIEATLCPPSEVGGVAGHMNVMKTASTEREVVGVVGMSCRFPRGGDGPEAFWQMLAGAVDAATQIPISRMDWRSLFAPASSGGALYTNHGAFIEDAEMFDCGAFHLSPAEAKCLYPHSGR